MALPNRGAAPYLVLGDPDINEPRVARNTNTIQDDLITTGTEKPSQLSFYSFQHWLKTYPDEDIAIVGMPVCDTGGLLEIEITSSEYDYTYPSDIVYEYDPDPPASDPVPDPNGDIGTQTADAGALDIQQLYPRWHTDDAYDFESIPISDLVPPAGEIFTFNESATSLPGWGYCSYEISVTNLDSEVLNVSTSTNEYYPFLQTTTDLKVTTKFKIKPHRDNLYICWNDGTIIKGKVGFRSYDVTADAVPDSTTPGYGYGGIEVTFGTTSADAGTADWEVTLEDGYVAAEITIPRTAGKVTFINDFWVTEVIKPS